jgi:hypothetical protein
MPLRLPPETLIINETAGEQTIMPDSAAEDMNTMAPEARYAALVEALHDSPGVTSAADLPRAKRFGSTELRVNDKIFVILSKGRLVVKLPRRRVDALLAAGAGERFDPGHGRLMKEWLSVDPAYEVDWLSLAREALAFVGSKT